MATAVRVRRPRVLTDLEAQILWLFLRPGFRGELTLNQIAELTDHMHYDRREELVKVLKKLQTKGLLSYPLLPRSKAATSELRLYAWGDNQLVVKALAKHLKHSETIRA